MDGPSAAEPSARHEAGALASPSALAKGLSTCTSTADGVTRSAIGSSVLRQCNVLIEKSTTVGDILPVRVGRAGGLDAAERARGHVVDARRGYHEAAKHLGAALIEPQPKATAVRIHGEEQ